MRTRMHSGYLGYYQPDSPLCSSLQVRNIFVVNYVFRLFPEIRQVCGNNHTVFYHCRPNFNRTEQHVRSLLFISAYIIRASSLPYMHHEWLLMFLLAQENSPIRIIRFVWSLYISLTLK